MSRKSSWWLRPQKKGASNRAALEEAKFFREDNKKLFGRIKELEDENDKLHELLLDCWDFSHLMHGAMAARFYELGLIGDSEARELGVEADDE